MEIKELSQKENIALVEVNLTTAEIDQTKEEVVVEMIKNITVKGFRQGKAPKSIAEKQLEPEKLSNHIFSHVLNHSVREVLKENKYQLLGRPVLDKFDPQKDGSWKVSFKFPLYPKFKLGDYKKAIQKTKTEDRKIDDIYDLLLKSTKIEIPSLLVEQEVEYSLEKLENHAKSINLTLEKYLEAVKKTKEEIQKEYAEKSAESIALDLILLEIANQEKIECTDQEEEELIKVSGSSVEQAPQIKSIIERRKTLDFLMKI